MPGSARGIKKKTARSDLAPLSREAIVAAAIGIADREGIEAVSLRSVAAALDAGPMRLYGHVDSKDALLALMVDAVHAELVRPPKGSVRKALTALAQSLRTSARKHPWFIGLLGGRPALGPNAFAHLEACLQALAFDDVDLALDALRLVRAYAIGAIQIEAADLASGRDREAWQSESWPAVAELIATGKYPMIERIVREAKHPKGAFERGLERVLAGVEASQAATTRAS